MYSIPHMRKNHFSNKDKEFYGIYVRRGGKAYELSLKRKYYGTYKTIEEAKKKRDDILNELYPTKKERMLYM